MNYSKTIKRLAYKKGYTLRSLKHIAGIHRETALSNPGTVLLTKILNGLDITQEQFYLELLRDSDLPSDFRVEIMKLTNKYFK